MKAYLTRVMSLVTFTFVLTFDGENVCTMAESMLTGKTRKCCSCSVKSTCKQRCSCRSNGKKCEDSCSSKCDNKQAMAGTSSEVALPAPPTATTAPPPGQPVAPAAPVGTAYLFPASSKRSDHNAWLSTQTDHERTRDAAALRSLEETLPNFSHEELVERIMRMAKDHPAVTTPYFTGNFSACDRPDSYGGVPDWCSCRLCQQLPTKHENPNIENRCCMQGEGNCRVMCVTSESYFFDLCMRQTVVDVGVENFAQTYFQKPDYSPAKYRNQAYRNYIMFQYGKVGRGVRIPVPACVAARIQWRYPEPSGQYTGFRFPPQ